jgi:hypothetical protein
MSVEHQGVGLRKLHCNAINQSIYELEDVTGRRKVKVCNEEVVSNK